MVVNVVLEVVNVVVVVVVLLLCYEYMTDANVHNTMKQLRDVPATVNCTFNTFTKLTIKLLLLLLLLLLLIILLLLLLLPRF